MTRLWVQTADSLNTTTLDALHSPGAGAGAGIRGSADDAVARNAEATLGGVVDDSEIPPGPPALPEASATAPGPEELVIIVTVLVPPLEDTLEEAEEDVTVCRSCRWVATRARTTGTQRVAHTSQTSTGRHISTFRMQQEPKLC